MTSSRAPRAVPGRDRARTALVTGSSSGIGRAIAARLHAAGWSVVLNGYRTQQTGDGLAAELGAGATYVDADVSDPLEARRLVDAAVPVTGRLDAVINNAGVARRIPHRDLEAVDDEFWDLVMGVNLKGPWNVTKAAWPHLRRAGGQVVNTGSLAGMAAAGSSVPYAVSKAGVLHLTRLLAKALGPEVRVNAIAPGYIDTPLTHDWEELRESTRRDAPAARLGTPEDAADAVMGLMAMDYVTGAVIPVDGGLHLS